MFTYEAKVLRVVDGDTIDALIDLGFDIHKKIRIRMVGINTPESRTRDLEEKKRGLAAKARLKEILKEHKNKFILESQGVGKYGRCLGIITIDGKSVNQQLITEGHAVEYFGGKR
jgi:micrococcal nuclease